MNEERSNEEWMRDNVVRITLLWELVIVLGSILLLVHCQGHVVPHTTYHMVREATPAPLLGAQSLTPVTQGIGWLQVVLVEHYSQNGSSSTSTCTSVCGWVGVCVCGWVYGWVCGRVCVSTFMYLCVGVYNNVYTVCGKFVCVYVIDMHHACLTKTC